MTEKNRRAQRIDEILGCLMILSIVVWILHSILFSSAGAGVVATHPAEVPQLEQSSASASAHQIRVISQNPAPKMGIQG